MEKKIVKYGEIEVELLLYDDEWVFLYVSDYKEGERIAILMYCLENEDDVKFELYADVTVNIPEKSISDKDCSYIDTNNNGQKLITWLEENGFGKTTGVKEESGFCTYPEFRFGGKKFDYYKNLFPPDYI